MTASSAELIRSEIEARILVVDDDPEVASLVADGLREAEPAWDIAVETDPGAALQRLDEDTFDCIVTDLAMPAVGGLDLALAARRRDADVALVAITGCASVENSVEAMRLGFADLIQKPFDLEALQAAVARSLQARRQAAAGGDGRVCDLVRAKTALEQANGEIQQKLEIASHDLVLSNRRMARQLEDAALASDVGRAIMGVIELEDLLGLCAELIGDRVSCHSSTIALVETPQNAVGLMVRAHPDDDEPPALCWLRNPLTSGVMIRAAQAGRSVHVESIAQSSLMHEHERDLWHDGRLLVVPMTVQENVMGVAVLHRDETADDFGAVDVKRVTELVRVMAPAVRTARLHHRQRCQMYATLEGIADAVESRDLYLRGHSGRVLAYATPLSLGMELPQCQVGALQIAARLHDIGRIAIPDMAVNHPGPLTDEQWQAVRAHPETGAAFLKPLDFFGEVGEIIRSHHESYDGTGYPNLKAGEEIHVVARVIAVADAFDAMTSHRPYRDAMTVAAARDQIARLAGQQFDPHIAEAFLALPEDLLASIQTSCR